MLNNYVRVIDKIKKEILSWAGDEFKDKIFIMGKNFMRFKFRTDDKLVYNKKINIPVCVISINSVIKKGDIIHSSNYKNISMKVKISNEISFVKKVGSMLK